MNNRIVKTSIIILTIALISGCGIKDGLHPLYGLKFYSGPMVAVVADDFETARDVAYLITACMGYSATPKGGHSDPTLGFEPVSEFADILIICPSTAEGWENPGGMSRCTYADGFKIQDKGLVIFGNPNAQYGVEIFLDGEPVEVPEAGFQKLRIVHAIALAAGDQELIEKFSNIPDDIDSKNFINWCREEMYPVQNQAFEPYDGDLPEPTYSSGKSIDEILTEHPDPFGARPVYLIPIKEQKSSAPDYLRYSREVAIPQDWSGARMMLHLPRADIILDVYSQHKLAASTIPSLDGLVGLGSAIGGEKFKIRLDTSTVQELDAATGTLQPIPPLNLAPFRIEATIPNAPQYKIFWDEETQQLVADCEFLSYAKPFRKSDIDSLPGGTFYCTAYHPDGETVRMSAAIPPKSPRNRITFPLSKQISWHLTDPQMYKFRFLYESKDGVDEYIAAYGYNRVTAPDGYFKFENWSAYLRGALDEKSYKQNERDYTFFRRLIDNGFNMYLASDPLSPRELYTAAEAGILTACISETNYLGPLSSTAFSNAIPPNYIQSPSWMGEAIIDGRRGANLTLSGLNFPNKLKFSTVDAGREWEIVPFPQHTIMMYEDGSDMSGLESALKFRGPISESRDEGVPECLAYYTSLDENGDPSGFSMFEFINIARGQEWCAGFIIPLDIYDPEEHITLMTDDFLILDIEGFPLDMPIKARRGSMLRIPARYANLKSKGDRSGAIFWVWEETGEERRVRYDVVPYKGIIDLPDIEVPVPKEPGEYRLRFQVIDFDGFVQAFNHLDVVVE